MRLTRLATPILLVLAAACGGSNSTGPSGNNLPNGTFLAKVDGSNFNAISATVLTAGQITSIGAANTAGHSMGFAWVEAGTGTFSISATSPNNALYTVGGAGWTAGPGGGSGSVTVTTRTATRIAGTFSFVLAASTGGATGTRTITNGSFDLTL